MKVLSFLIMFLSGLYIVTNPIVPAFAVITFTIALLVFSFEVFYA